MKRRAFIAIAAQATLVAPWLSTLTGGEPAGNGANTLADVWRRAVEFLWSHQADDGGWHSRNYALMRSGQALTPYVLQALLAVPGEVCPSPREGVAKGLAFIRDHGRRAGALGIDDPELPEYPCHSTAAAISCLLIAGDPDDREQIARFVEYLLRAQYGEHQGFSPDHLAYGAWGFAAPRRRGVADHLDISHTRHVLQALRSAEVRGAARVEAGVYDRALTFLRLLQRHPTENRSHPQPIDWPDDAARWDGRAPSFDGGFYFSPVALSANKGGWNKDPSHWRSYATATCDGLLALRAANIPDKDPRLEAAVRWLQEHAPRDFRAGVPGITTHPWGAALRFYHAAVHGECSALIGGAQETQSALIRFLDREQQPDGSFVNRAGALMKEDDPLLCTALAVKAMTATFGSTEVVRLSVGVSCR